MHGFGGRAAGETVGHYELLCRTAKAKGWRVLLRSTGNKHGDKWHQGHSSELSEIALYDADAELVARLQLLEDEPLDLAAAQILAAIERQGMRRQ